MTTINASTKLDSPRWVARGCGARQGTVAELVADLPDRASAKLGYIVQELADRLGWDDAQVDELYENGTVAEFVANNVTLHDMRTLLDDPNVRVIA